MARHGSMKISSPSLELAHVELAGGRALLGAVGLAVDHHPARAADALAAVVLEGDRLAALGVEPLVHDVEHLEEAHLLADVGDVVGLHGAGGIGAGLAPDVELHVHEVFAASTCTSAGTGGRCRTRAAPCGAWACCPRRAHSHAATWANWSSSRSASPSSVWCSSRKWPPQDSSRSRASRTMSSPSSKKSATRPALSRRLVHGPVAEHPHVLPELLAQRRDLGQRLLEAGLVAGHAAVVPHDLAELAVVVVDRLRAADRQEPLHPVVHVAPGPRRTPGRRPGPGRCRAGRPGSWPPW